MSKIYSITTRCGLSSPIAGPSAGSNDALRWVWLFVAPFLFSGVGFSQELITDRPDQTESAAVVPAGDWQLEIGATYEWGEVDSITLPGTLLRWGLGSKFELRLGWEGWISVSSNGSVGSTGHDSDGLGDGELGGKLLLREGSGASPQFALLFATSLPLGDAGFTTDEFDPSFRFAMDRDLTDRLGMGVNLGVEWETVGESNEASWIYTLVLGVDLGATTGAFLEIFGSEPTEGGAEGSLSFDGGFTWLLAPEVQLDLAAGVRLSGEAADGFIGLGLSIRR